MVLSSIVVCVSSDELSTYICDKWGLKDAGFNYNLAAIFGSQSTGKSKSTITFVSRGNDCCFKMKNRTLVTHTQCNAMQRVYACMSYAQRRDGSEMTLIQVELKKN